MRSRGQEGGTLVDPGSRERRVVGIAIRGRGAHLPGARRADRRRDERLDRIRLVTAFRRKVEARDIEGEVYGFGRLEATLRRAAGATATELRDALLADVDAYAGEMPAEDDRTVLIVRRPRA